MKIIESSVIEITEKDPLKKIEQIGRTCYKSEDRITDTSYKSFVMNMIMNKHYAMLEHAVFTFFMSSEFIELDIDTGTLPSKFFNISLLRNGRAVVSANIRSILESHGYTLDEIIKILGTYKPEVLSVIHGYGDTLKCSKESYIVSDESQLPESVRDNHVFRTFKFTTDRGVSHELVRHRVASFAQESTRYCNYSKDKFGNEITVIKPCITREDFENSDKEVFYANWDIAMRSAENAYFNMLNSGATPQEARSVLPNSLKTEIVVTANQTEWHHIGDLRYRGTTGKPHPDMLELMRKLKAIYPEL